MRKLFFILLFFIVIGAILINCKFFQPKNELKQEYLKAIDYCKKQQLHSSSETALCHYEQLNNKNLGEDYIKIRELCYKKSPITSDIWACVDEIILK